MLNVTDVEVADAYLNIHDIIQQQLQHTRKRHKTRKRKKGKRNASTPNETNQHYNSLLEAHEFDFNEDYDNIICLPCAAAPRDNNHSILKEEKSVDDTEIHVEFNDSPQYYYHYIPEENHMYSSKRAPHSKVKEINPPTFSVVSERNNRVSARNAGILAAEVHYSNFDNGCLDSLEESGYPYDWPVEIDSEFVKVFAPTNDMQPQHIKIKDIMKQIGEQTTTKDSCRPLLIICNKCSTEYYCLQDGNQPNNTCCPNDKCKLYFGKSLDKNVRSNPFKSALIAKAPTKALTGNSTRGRKQQREQSPRTRSTSPVPHTVRHWLMDTGCPFDLLQKSEALENGIQVQKLAKPFSLNAAGQKTPVREFSDVFLAPLGREASPYVLESTPNVLSLCKRVLYEGYSFKWMKDQPPTLILPNGKEVTLVLINDVPYLDTSSLNHNEVCAAATKHIIPKMIACPAESDNDEPNPETMSQDRIDDPAFDIKIDPANNQQQEVQQPPSEDEPDEERDPDYDGWEDFYRLEDGKIDWKKEATSLRHLMTHFPKNKYCLACQMAKMEHKRHPRKVSKPPKDPQFGRRITSDHIISKNEQSKSLMGDTAAIVHHDLDTGDTDIWAVADKRAELAELTFREFLGPDVTISHLHSDSSPELIKAAKDTGLFHDPSTPGIPEANGVVERQGRFVLEGARTVLEQAGVPHRLWPEAARYICMARRISMRNGDSIWNKKFKEGHFKGPLLCFGERVMYLQSPIYDAQEGDKWADARVGVFLGYFLKPGGTWKGEFLVADLNCFTHVNYITGRRLHSGRACIKVQRVLDVKRDGNDVVFPLKVEYDKAFRTIAGLRLMHTPVKRSRGIKDSALNVEPAIAHDEDEATVMAQPSTEAVEEIVSPEDVIKPNTLHDNSLETFDKWWNENFKDDNSQVKRQMVRDFFAKALARQGDEPLQFGQDMALLGNAVGDSPRVQLPENTTPYTPYDRPIGPSLEPPGGSTSFNNETRKWKGSTRPPWMHSQLWATMSHKERQELGKSYLKQYMDSRPDSEWPAAPAAVDDVPRLPRNYDVIQQHNEICSRPSPWSSMYDCAVARKVKPSEIRESEDAQAALVKEWTRLRDAFAWDDSTVRELDEVIAEARAEGREINTGDVFAFVVEKGAELEKGNPLKKMKGRAVFGGHNVKNQDGDFALFQDLGSSPSTIEASKLLDFVSQLPGNAGQQADANQAYTQAAFVGTETWITLPVDAWLDSWKGMRRPAVRLRKALYGHPDSGSFWEQHCHKHVTEAGFELLDPVSWPSVYYHANLDLYLSIYVDDFKMAGNRDNLIKGWDLLKKNIDLDTPEAFGRYLGCLHEQGEAVLQSGAVVRFMRYNMRDFLVSCCEKYQELTGTTGKPFKFAATPFRTEKDTNVRECGGRCTKCNALCCALEPDDYNLGINTKVPPSYAGACGTAASATPVSGTTAYDPENKTHPLPDDWSPPGKLTASASKILMKVLYAARHARNDLLRGINHLATRITKWDEEDDKDLYRLMCYVWSTLDHMQVGWVSQDPSHLSQINIKLYTDADFAGDKSTSRSTSGIFIRLEGPATDFPIAGASKKQTCTSQSTPEAETIAAELGVRTEGIPLITIVSHILHKEAQVTLREDNNACLQNIRQGRFPTMKHVSRTHGVNVHFLTQCMNNPATPLLLERCETDAQSADIFTKKFANKDKWNAVRRLINIDLCTSFFREFDIKPCASAIAPSRGVFFSGRFPTYDFSYVGGQTVMDALETDSLPDDEHLTIDSRDHFDCRDTPKHKLDTEPRSILNNNATTHADGNAISVTTGGDNVSSIDNKHHNISTENDDRTHSTLASVDTPSSAEAKGSPIPYTATVDAAAQCAVAARATQCVALDKTMYANFAHTTTVIEICCSGHSTLSSFIGPKHTSVRITEEDDFRLPETGQYIVDVIRRSNKGSILIHISLPCTGGSSIQQLNIATGRGTEKIKQYWLDFAKFMSNLSIVLRAAKEMDAFINLEWPKGCSYWKDPRVQKLIRRYGLQRTQVDGCQYLLKSINPQDFGMLIKKPWFFASNMMSLSRTALTCTGGHPHAQCLMDNAKLSERYTIKLVRWIHTCFKEEVTNYHKSSIPCACAVFVGLLDSHHVQHNRDAGCTAALQLSVASAFYDLCVSPHGGLPFNHFRTLQLAIGGAMASSNPNIITGTDEPSQGSVKDKVTRFGKTKAPSGPIPPATPPPPKTGSSQIYNPGPVRSKRAQAKPQGMLVAPPASNASGSVAPPINLEPVTPQVDRITNNVNLHVFIEKNPNQSLFNAEEIPWLLETAVSGTDFCDEWQDAVWGPPPVNLNPLTGFLEVYVYPNDCEQLNQVLEKARPCFHMCVASGNFTDFKALWKQYCNIRFSHVKVVSNAINEPATTNAYFDHSYWTAVKNIEYFQGEQLERAVQINQRLFDTSHEECFRLRTQFECYQVLGMSTTRWQENHQTVKRRCRELFVRWHPDKMKCEVENMFDISLISTGSQAMDACAVNPMRKQMILLNAEMKSYFQSLRSPTPNVLFTLPIHRQVEGYVRGQGKIRQPRPWHTEQQTASEKAPPPPEPKTATPHPLEGPPPQQPPTTRNDASAAMPSIASPITTKSPPPAAVPARSPWADEADDDDDEEQKKNYVFDANTCGPLSDEQMPNIDDLTGRVGQININQEKRTDLSSQPKRPLPKKHRNRLSLIGTNSTCNGKCKRDKTHYPWLVTSYECKNTCCLANGTHITGDQCICIFCANGDSISSDREKKAIKPMIIIRTLLPFHTDEEDIALGPSSRVWAQMATITLLNFAYVANTKHHQALSTWVKENPLSDESMKSGLRRVSLLAEVMSYNNFFDPSMFNVFMWSDCVANNSPVISDHVAGLTEATDYLCETKRTEATAPPEGLFFTALFGDSSPKLWSEEQHKQMSPSHYLTDTELPNHFGSTFVADVQSGATLDTLIVAVNDYRWRNALNVSRTNAIIIYFCNEICGKRKGKCYPGKPEFDQKWLDDQIRLKHELSHFRSYVIVCGGDAKRWAGDDLANEYLKRIRTSFRNNLMPTVDGSAWQDIMCKYTHSDGMHFRATKESVIGVQHYVIAITNYIFASRPFFATGEIYPYLPQNSVSVPDSHPTTMRVSPLYTNYPESSSFKCDPHPGMHLVEFTYQSQQFNNMAQRIQSWFRKQHEFNMTNKVSERNVRPLSSDEITTNLMNSTSLANEHVASAEGNALGQQPSSSSAEPADPVSKVFHDLRQATEKVIVTSTPTGAVRDDDAPSISPRNKEDDERLPAHIKQRNITTHKDLYLVYHHEGSKCPLDIILNYYGGCPHNNDWHNFIAYSSRYRPVPHILGCNALGDLKNVRHTGKIMKFKGNLSDSLGFTSTDNYTWKILSVPSIIEVPDTFPDMLRHLFLKQRPLFCWEDVEKNPDMEELRLLPLRQMSYPWPQYTMENYFKWETLKEITDTEGPRRIWSVELAYADILVLEREGFTEVGFHGTNAYNLVSIITHGFLASKTEIDNYCKDAPGTYVFRCTTRTTWDLSVLMKKALNSYSTLCPLFLNGLYVGLGFETRHRTNGFTGYSANKQYSLDDSSVVPVKLIIEGIPCSKCKAGTRWQHSFFEPTLEVSPYCKQVVERVKQRKIHNMVNRIQTLCHLNMFNIASDLSSSMSSTGDGNAATGVSSAHPMDVEQPETVPPPAPQVAINALSDSGTFTALGQAPNKETGATTPFNMLPERQAEFGEHREVPTSSKVEPVTPAPADATTAKEEDNDDAETAPQPWQPPPPTPTEPALDSGEEGDDEGEGDEGDDDKDDKDDDIPPEPTVQDKLSEAEETRAQDIVDYYNAMCSAATLAEVDHLTMLVIDDEVKALHTKVNDFDKFLHDYTSGDMKTITPVIHILKTCLMHLGGVVAELQHIINNDGNYMDCGFDYIANSMKAYYKFIDDNRVKVTVRNKDYSLNMTADAISSFVDSFIKPDYDTVDCLGYMDCKVDLNELLAKYNKKKEEFAAHYNLSTIRILNKRIGQATKSSPFFKYQADENDELDRIEACDHPSKCYDYLAKPYHLPRGTLDTQQYSLDERDAYLRCDAAINHFNVPENQDVQCTIPGLTEQDKVAWASITIVSIKEVIEAFETELKAFIETFTSPSCVSIPSIVPSEQANDISILAFENLPGVVQSIDIANTALRALHVRATMLAPLSCIYDKDKEMYNHLMSHHMRDVPKSDWSPNYKQLVELGQKHATQMLIDSGPKICVQACIRRLVARTTHYNPIRFHISTCLSEHNGSILRSWLNDVPGLNLVRANYLLTKPLWPREHFSIADQRRLSTSGDTTSVIQNHTESIETLREQFETLMKVFDMNAHHQALLKAMLQRKINANASLTKPKHVHPVVNADGAVTFEFLDRSPTDDNPVVVIVKDEIIEIESDADDKKKKSKPKAGSGGNAAGSGADASGSRDGEGGEPAPKRSRSGEHEREPPATLQPSLELRFDPVRLLVVIEVGDPYRNHQVKLTTTMQASSFHHFSIYPSIMPNTEQTTSLEKCVPTIDRSWAEDSWCERVAPLNPNVRQQFPNLISLPLENQEFGLRIWNDQADDKLLQRGFVTDDPRRWLNNNQIVMISKKMTVVLRHQIMKYHDATLSHWMMLTTLQRELSNSFDFLTNFSGLQMRELVILVAKYNSGNRFRIGVIFNRVDGKSAPFIIQASNGWSIPIGVPEATMNLISYNFMKMTSVLPQSAPWLHFTKYVHIAEIMYGGLITMAGRQVHMGLGPDDGTDLLYTDLYEHQCIHRKRDAIITINVSLLAKWAATCKRIILLSHRKYIITKEVPASTFESIDVWNYTVNEFQCIFHRGDRGRRLCDGSWPIKVGLLRPEAAKEQWGIDNIAKVQIHHRVTLEQVHPSRGQKLHNCEAYNNTIDTEGFLPDALDEQIQYVQDSMRIICNMCIHNSAIITKNLFGLWHVCTACRRPFRAGFNVCPRKDCSHEVLFWTGSDRDGNYREKVMKKYMDEDNVQDERKRRRQVDLASFSSPHHVNPVLQELVQESEGPGKRRKGNRDNAHRQAWFNDADYRMVCATLGMTDAQTRPLALHPYHHPNPQNPEAPLPEADDDKLGITHDYLSLNIHDALNPGSGDNVILGIPVKMAYFALECLIAANFDVNEIPPLMDFLIAGGIVFEAIERALIKIGVNDRAMVFKVIKSQFPSAYPLGVYDNNLRKHQACIDRVLSCMWRYKVRSRFLFMSPSAYQRITGLKHLPEFVNDEIDQEENLLLSYDHIKDTQPTAKLREDELMSNPMRRTAPGHSSRAIGAPGSTTPDDWLRGDRSTGARMGRRFLAGSAAFMGGGRTFEIDLESQCFNPDVLDEDVISTIVDQHNDSTTFSTMKILALITLGILMLIGIISMLFVIFKRKVDNYFKSLINVSDVSKLNELVDTGKQQVEQLKEAKEAIAETGMVQAARIGECIKRVNADGNMNKENLLECLSDIKHILAVNDKRVDHDLKVAYSHTAEIVDAVNRFEGILKSQLTSLKSNRQSADAYKELEEAILLRLKHFESTLVSVLDPIGNILHLLPQHHTQMIDMISKHNRLLDTSLHLPNEQISAARQELEDAILHKLNRVESLIFGQTVEIKGAMAQGASVMHDRLNAVIVSKQDELSTSLEESFMSIKRMLTSGNAVMTTLLDKEVQILQNTANVNCEAIIDIMKQHRDILEHVQQLVTRPELNEEVKRRLTQTNDLVANLSRVSMTHRDEVTREVRGLTTGIAITQQETIHIQGVVRKIHSLIDKLDGCAGLFAIDAIGNLQNQTFRCQGDVSRIAINTQWISTEIVQLLRLVVNHSLKGGEKIMWQNAISQTTQDLNRRLNTVEGPHAPDQQLWMNVHHANDPTRHYAIGATEYASLTDPDTEDQISIVDSTHKTPIPQQFADGSGGYFYDNVSFRDSTPTLTIRVKDIPKLTHLFRVAINAAYQRDRRAAREAMVHRFRLPANFEDDQMREIDPDFPRRPRFDPDDVVCYSSNPDECKTFSRLHGLPIVCRPWLPETPTTPNLTSRYPAALPRCQYTVTRQATALETRGIQRSVGTQTYVWGSDVAVQTPAKTFNLDEEIVTSPNTGIAIHETESITRPLRFSPALGGYPVRPTLIVEEDEGNRMTFTFQSMRSVCHYWECDTVVALFHETVVSDITEYQELLRLVLHLPVMATLYEAKEFLLEMFVKYNEDYFVQYCPGSTEGIKAVYLRTERLSDGSFSEQATGHIDDYSRCMKDYGYKKNNIVRIRNNIASIDIQAANQIFVYLPPRDCAFFREMSTDQPMAEPLPARELTSSLRHQYAQGLEPEGEHTLGRQVNPLFDVADRYNRIVEREAEMREDFALAQQMQNDEVAQPEPNYVDVNDEDDDDIPQLLPVLDPMTIAPENMAINNFQPLNQPQIIIQTPEPPPELPHQVSHEPAPYVPRPKAAPAGLRLVIGPQMQGRMVFRGDREGEVIVNDDVNRPDEEIHYVPRPPVPHEDDDDLEDSSSDSDDSIHYQSYNGILLRGRDAQDEADFRTVMRLMPTFPRFRLNFQLGRWYMLMFDSTILRYAHFNPNMTVIGALQCNSRLIMLSLMIMMTPECVYNSLTNLQIAELRFIASQMLFPFGFPLYQLRPTEDRFAFHMVNALQNLSRHDILDYMRIYQRANRQHLISSFTYETFVRIYTYWGQDLPQFIIDLENLMSASRLVRIYGSVDTYEDDDYDPEAYRDEVYGMTPHLINE